MKMRNHEIRLVQVDVQHRLRRNGPLIPPVTNRETKPMANNMGEVKRMCPCHSVPSQLNVLIADGTPMPMVMIENANAVYGLMPLMNM